LENYYEILGVSQTATQDEIKKAFRTKSKTMHPDKGGNEEDFKRINEAYDTLGNEEKRAQYDQRGSNPFGGSDPFADMFGSFFNGFGQQQRRAPEKIIDLNVGVIDSFVGKEHMTTFTRKVQCSPCQGQGGERVTCHVCQGQGFIIQRMGNSFFSNVVKVACTGCSGRGHNFKKTCNICYGDGRVDEIQQINIKLPIGITDGQFIKGQGYGDYFNGMYGDVIFKINIVPQDGFERNNKDLIYNKFLSLSDLNSETINIPHPDGELSLSMPIEIDTSKPLRVRGKGFKHENGDLYVNLYIKHTRL